MSDNENEYNSDINDSDDDESVKPFVKKQLTSKYYDEDEETENENEQLAGAQKNKLILTNYKTELEEGEVDEEDEDEADEEDMVPDDDDDDINYDDADSIDNDNEESKNETNTNNEKQKNKNKLTNQTMSNKSIVTNKIPVNFADDDEDEDDDYDDNYLQKFDNSLNTNYVNEFHPECLIHNYDEIKKLSTVVRNGEGIIIDPFHKTIPFLTKYERAKILGQRAKQIEMPDAQIFVRVPENVIDSYIIAELELQEKKLPFIIRRPIPGGGCEYWNIVDLENINY